MKEQLLSQGWTLTIPEENVYHIPPEPIPVTVPGSVYSGLLENGLMPDPYWRDNELNALKLMENDVVFTERFAPDPQLLDCDQVILRFDGVDTIADIELNGRRLGHVENMHRSYEYAVKGLLNGSGNELKITIHSPMRAAAAARAGVHNMESTDAVPGYSQLRKAHCMFGWDWGPRLPDAGLYRPVRLLGVSKARFSDDIRIVQEHHIAGTGVCGNEVDRVRLSYTARIVYQKPSDDTDPSSTCSAARGVHVEAALEAPDGTVCCFEPITSDSASHSVCGETAEGELLVTEPKLWWPNGYGQQPLYTVMLRLVDDADGEELDRCVRRIGLRTVTVDVSEFPEEEREPHIGPQVKRDVKTGRHFDFVVNGLHIFAMGADYIPEDNVLQRVTRERTERLLKDAAEANHNAIRVWGGGYYPDDFFYDMCDEYGLLVWQDFMFACSSYELNDALEENLRAEFTEAVRRIRHHASLGLWCGNNEMETEFLDNYWGGRFNSVLPWAKGDDPGYKIPPKQFNDYIKLYEYILPTILKEEDPNAFYWPSSPSSGGNFEDSYEENIGDAHYWGVWHGGDQFSDYRRHHFRFLSEFGFQSFPCMATVKAFTEEGDRNIFSEIMEMHQRNASANGKIMNYLSATYRYPKDFERLLYCSQMLQLDAIRYGVEYFRRIRGTCMGTLVWQLNDIWPVASWSSIDYYGRWKALHYGEKRFFAPVSITCEEHGRLDQKPCVNSLPIPVEYSAQLHVANETAKEVRGLVRWQLRRPDSSVIRQGEQEVAVPPFGGVWLDKEVFNQDGDERDMHLYYEFWQNGEVISSGSSLFVAPKHYHFADPELTVTAEEGAVVVTSRAYAKGVCIESQDGNLRLADNFFDMEAGTRRIPVVGELPAGALKICSVYEIDR